MGLLFLRVVAAIVLIADGFVRLGGGPPAVLAVNGVLSVAAGILLLAGLWTPFSGALVAFAALWTAISQSGDPRSNALLASIGLALALIGPGIWSVDARLFGWKRIDIRDRES